jgi:hypothetical protein
MPKRCRRDEARIRNFGHQKKQRTSNNENEENTGPQAIPAAPHPKLLQTHTFLQPAIPLNPLGLHNINTEVTRQIASVESERVKQK